MNQPRVRAMSRLALLLVVLGVIVALGAAAFYGHKLRKRALLASALDEGLAAYAAQDWSTASTKLNQYLSAVPNDPNLLTKFAEAQIALRPFSDGALARAIRSYRNVLRLEPNNRAVFQRLALLYLVSGNFDELAHIADLRLEVAPDDPAAIVARCRALVYREQLPAARTQLEALIAQLAAESPTPPELADAYLLLSEVVMRSGVPDATAQALQLMDTALTHDPTQPMLNGRRAALLVDQSSGKLPADSPTRAQVREALQSVEAHYTEAPASLLLAASLWMGIGDNDQARAAIAQAQQLPPEVVREYIVDANDWYAACFALRADLTQAAGTPAELVALANEGLQELDGKRQKLTILPIAVRLLLAGNEVTQARAVLDELLARVAAAGQSSAANPQLTLLEALVAHAEDKPYVVIDRLEPLLSGPDVSPQVTALLLEAYNATGQPGRAQRLLGNVAVAPENMPAALRLAAARQALREGAWQAAIDELAPLQDAQQQLPEVAVMSLTAELGRAFDSRATGADLTPVLEHARGVAAEFPKRADVRVLLATALELQGDVAAAEQELQDATQTTDDPLPAWVALARMYADHDRAADVVPTLRAACAALPTQAQPWLLLAEQLSATGHPDEAQQAVAAGLERVQDADQRRALEIRQGVQEVLYGDEATGLAELRRLADADPTDARLRAGLLEVPTILKDKEAADKLIAELRGIEGDTGVDWRLAQVRYWLSNDQWQSHAAEVAQYLKYCMDADPRLVAPVLMLGDFYVRQGDLARAEATYAAGLEATGSSLVADELLGVLQRQQRYAEAQALLDRLQKQLGRSAFGERRFWLAVETGNYDDAISELELRGAQDRQAPEDLVRLARLVYARDHDAAKALKHLDDAAARGAGPLDVARARVAILRAENRIPEAVAALDQLVTEQHTPDALLMRAGFYASVGDLEHAEQDYQKLAAESDSDMGAAVLGEFYAQQGKLDEALTQWEAGLKAHADSEMLRRGICKALLWRGRAEDGARVDQLLGELKQRVANPDVELLWLQAARLAQQYPNEITARLTPIFRAVLQAPPSTADAYAGLADLALRANQLEFARAIAARGLDVQPNTTTLQMRQAEAELGLGNSATATALAESVLRSDPKNVRALRIVLQSAANESRGTRLRDGVRRVETLLAESPENEQLQTLRADALVAMKAYDEAATKLEAYRAEDPSHDTLPVLLTLARIERLRGDLTAARTYVETAMAKSADAPEVTQERFRLLAAERRFDDLVALAQQEAAAASPDPETLMAAVGVLQNEPTMQKPALELVSRVVELEPGVAEPAVILGTLRYGAGDLNGAAAAFRQALQADPQQTDALNNLAWILGSQPNAAAAQMEEARRLAQQAVDLRPREAQYHDTLATVLSHIPERQAEAKDAYKQCAALTPAGTAFRARTLYHLAQITRTLGDAPEAADYAREAQQIHTQLTTAGAPGAFTPAELAELEQWRKTVN